MNTASIIKGFVFDIRFFMRQQAVKEKDSYDFLLTNRYGKIRTVRFLTFGAFKRGFDLVFATVALVGLSPLLIVVATAIKIDSQGPVFFKQERTGKNGKVFKMYKFRSMAADNDVKDKSCEDKYTKVGKMIRRTSIDELPQLINVVKGQMSLIGPRPWMVEYWENMTEEERGRTKVRPGITGLAAVKGRNGLTIFEKIKYDLEYVNNYSLWMDTKVFALTIKTILSREGASSSKGAIHDELAALKLRDYDKEPQRAKNKGRVKEK